MGFEALDLALEQNHSGGYTQIMSGPDGSKLALRNGETLAKPFVPLSGGATTVYNVSGLACYRHVDWLGSSPFDYDRYGNLTTISATQCSAPILSLGVNTNNLITNSGFSYPSADGRRASAPAGALVFSSEAFGGILTPQQLPASSISCFRRHAHQKTAGRRPGRWRQRGYYRSRYRLQ
jgi:hypothetical protein